MRTEERKIIFSDRAYADILAETLEHIHTETGGILLGLRHDDGCWYVVEALDPGPRAILRPSYFEYDHDYLTHLANKVARRYRTRLRLVGLWHRHPGSFDSFSSVDDSTNSSYAELLGGSAVSMLVNLDPDFRLTAYEVRSPPLDYQRLRIEIGDACIGQELLSVWEPKSLLARLRQISSGRLEPVGRTRELTDRVESRDRALEPQLETGRRWWPPWRLRKTKRSPLSGDPPREEILEILDSELAYLDSQPDYEYELALEGDGLDLHLRLVSRLEGYPEDLRFRFRHAASRILVGFEGTEEPFERGYVQRKLHEHLVGRLRRPAPREAV